MAAFFTPESPLGQEVQRLLLDAPDGLTIHEIRRALRLKGKHIEESNLRELLSHPQVFAQLSGDRYCLRGHLQAAREAVLPPPAAGDEVPAPLLENFPLATDDYVVVDLETTGFDPSRDRIIQFVAIRYVGGRPVAARNFYLSPGPIRLAASVRSTLGLDRYPAVEEAMLTGPAFEEIRGEVQAFLGDLPIVAHNARFDAGFLIAGLGELTNPVIDTLELAVLLCPELRRYQLDVLAESLDVDAASARAIWADANGPDPLVPIGQETLHNAITDTCLLAAVYRRLIERWRRLEGPMRAVVTGLLPELAGRRWEGIAPDLAAAFAARAIRPIAGGDAPEILAEPSGFAGVEDLYARFAAANGLEERSGQRTMMRFVWEALTGERFKLIEAPTGTGKTLAYLLPSVVHAVTTGERVAILTAFRNLQDQLLAEIERLRHSTGLPFRSQVIKGRDNYVCLDRLARYANGLGVDATLAERYSVACLATLLLTCPEATRDDLSPWLLNSFPVARHVAAEVAADRSECRSQRCEELGCLLPRVTAEAKQSHIIVLNHALWLAEPGRLPPVRHIIVDEAHTLEDFATTALTQEVSRATLERQLSALYDPATRRGLVPRLQAASREPTIALRGRQLYGVLQALRTLVPDFGRHLSRYICSRDGKVDPRYGAAQRLEADPRRIDSTRWATVEQARNQLFGLHVTHLINLIRELLDAVAEWPATDEVERLRRELRAVYDDLTDQVLLQEEIVRAGNRHWVFWVEVEPTIAADSEENEATNAPGWALKSASVRVDRALGERYDQLASATFVSATLTVRGDDFSFFVDRLGLASRLGSDDLHQVPSDLPYERNAFLGLANYLVYTPVERTMRSFQEELAGELNLLLDYTDGRALVLFTARARMMAVYERCEPELGRRGIPVLCQQPGISRRQLQEDFAARRESVLFGLRSFWEGVDIPGESLSFVVMEKLPFPFLFDPIVRARREDVVRRGQHEFDDYLFPLMALQFKQGFGRLIRRRDDRGAVILMDKRIHRKSYKADLLASLPGFMPRDEQAERTRAGFYRALAERLPELIDLEQKRELLDALPQEILPDLVQRLNAFQLPERVPEEDYPAWRDTLLGALREVFGFDGFRSAEQEQVIRAMLAGRDVLALLPTGAGKSLCFQLTALLRRGVTLVFSPLIALMRDQVQSLQARGIEIVSAIYSGQPADEREEILARMRAGKVRLVYIAPERMRDPQLLAALTDTEITQVVVDEAHCVSMWGPSFRPDFLYLPRLFDVIGRRPPVAAFTATATPVMRANITRELNLSSPVEITASFDRPELRFVVYNRHSRYNAIRSKSDRFQTLMKILQAADRTRESVLVYVSTTVEADLLARRLRTAGFDARAYHGRMTTAERDSVQELFMDDHVNIVVCTKAFGMGIDQPDIRYVIHYQMPGDLESYFQEAGRAGRDGREAWCVLLYHPSDRNVHDYFIESGTPDPEVVNELLTYLRKMPGDVLHLDTAELQEALRIDEIGLRVALHLLERAGFLERGPDFTMRAALTLRADPAEVTAHLRKRSREGAELFSRMTSELAVAPHRRVEVNLLNLAARLDVDPSVLDAILVQVAADDLALYRPWEKGMTVMPHRRLREGTRYDADAQAAAHHKALRDKLDMMIAYAEATTGCRRAMILRYFGEEPVTERCGQCDLCVPEAEYPWSHITARDTPDLAGFFDPAFTFLEAIKWNLDRMARGRSPYSTNTIITILCGDSYAARNREASPERRNARLRDLQSCPFWGVFDTLPRREATLNATFERLKQEGYVCEDVTSFNLDGTDRVYRYPVLLPKGREQLLSGEALAW